MFIKYIINLLAISLFFIFNSNFAQAAVSILNTGVRQTAADGLDFTFYTKGESSESPIVKDKGGNQYVILLPNLVDSSGRQPDLRAVSDIVSDINVKTINEGAVTYTKVSVTTKKPVKINVHTRKTSQSASELSGVNDIISKVSLINQDIQSSKSVQAQAEVGVVQTLPKLTSVQDILDNKNSIGTVKPAVDVKKEQQKISSAPAVVKVSAPSNTVAAHVPSNTKTIKADTKKLQNENIKNVRQEAVKKIDTIEKNIKSSIENNVSVNDDESIFDVAVNENEVVEEQSPVEFADVSEKGFDLSKMLASPFALVLFFGLIGLIVLMFIVNKMRLVLDDSQEIGSSFVQRMNSVVPSRLKKDYTKLAQNPNLTWQEKYNSFKDGKIQEQKELVNSYVGADVDEDLDLDAEEYSEVSDIIPEENNESLPDITESSNLFAARVEMLSNDNVADDGDVISGTMKRAFRGFADDGSISRVKRNTGLNNRFKSFESSSVKGLQRNMDALLDAVIQMDEEKPVRMVSQVGDEEIIETEAIATSKNINVATLPVQKVQPPVVKQRPKLKIKESRAIDDARGFYLVDMEDKLALMGRINDKFTVLKKFDDKEKRTLQVRRDKDNLYMVRTDGFKMLVDVEQDKMGVLAEL